LLLSVPRQLQLHQVLLPLLLLLLLLLPMPPLLPLPQLLLLLLLLRHHCSRLHAPSMSWSLQQPWLFPAGLVCVLLARLLPGS
jgi:hypothetical protein